MKPENFQYFFLVKDLQVKIQPNELSHCLIQLPRLAAL